MQVVKCADEVEQGRAGEATPLLAYSSSTSHETGDAPPFEEERKIDKKSFLTACAANLYEYYDFALLGFFATEISASLFPSDEPGATGIIQLYVLYAVGFVARPFGGLVFGYLGDKFGRSRSLTIAMILMSFPTFLTGCLPGFDLIGWGAPLILLVLRILQGLSTGGENSSAAIYTFETAPHERRAFWLSVFGICSSGTLFASLSHVILDELLTEQQIMSWGWRIPFLLGLGLFVFSLVAQKWLKTTETFAAVESSVQNADHNPIKDTCSRQRGQFLKFVLASSLQHGAAYLVFVFLPTYLSSDVMRGASSDGFTDENAFIFNTINSIAYLPMCVAVGYFVDRIGAIPFLSVSALSITVMAPFVFYGFAVSTSSILNWALHFLLTVALCPILGGTSYFWYIDSLLSDPTTRVTVYGVGYNLGAALFGGTATLIGTAMVQTLGPTDGMVWSGVWLSILAIICVVTIGFVEYCEKTKQKEKVVFHETSPIVIQSNHSNASSHGSTAGSTKGLFTIREASCESTDFDGFDRDSNGNGQFEQLQSASRKLFG